MLNIGAREIPSLSSEPRLAMRRTTYRSEALERHRRAGVAIAGDRDALQLFVAGYALHDDHHVEWPPDNSGGQVEIERRFRAGLTWRR
jgi:hypothetical protein